MKKLLLSVAVATIVAAPIAQAGSSLTGSLRYGVDINSNDDNAFTVKNYGSRIKMAGDTAIGSNTGYGKLELRLADSRNGGVVNRTYAVGMKGDFGDLSVGVQDTAFDQATADRSWWNGANTGLVGDRNEKHGAVRYNKSFGAVSLTAGAAMQATGAEDLDLFDIALKYSGGPITVAAAMQSKEFDAVAAVAGALPTLTTAQVLPVAASAARTGSAVSVMGGYNWGSGDATLTYGVEDEDFTGTVERTALLAQFGMGDFYGFYGQSELDGAAETPTLIGVGYTQNLSDQSLIWYELFSEDADDGSDAVTALNAAFKIDF